MIHEALAPGKTEAGKAKRQRRGPAEWLLPLAVFAAMLAVWWLLALGRAFPRSAFPTPGDVWVEFGRQLTSPRLYNDIIASLFRVMTGFYLAVFLSVPLGLWLGQRPVARAGFLPAINFFRNLSPLAWIPFAVLWFQTGTRPAVFLIFLCAFFPMLLAVMSAVATIPSVYFQVARDYNIRGFQLLTRVTLPAIMPEFITTLRVTAGISWMVVVAAEMLAGNEGLGFSIWDARNALRVDWLVVVMIVIGVIGVVIDRVLELLTRVASVRWGYER